MEKLVITGGTALHGTIPISGAKNAALPLMCTCLLTDEPVTLENLPRLADITTLTDLLNHLGVTVTIEGGRGGMMTGRSLTFDAHTIHDTVAPYDIVRKMRASILVLGPLVARAGEATVSLPGAAPSARAPLTCTSRPLRRLVQRSRWNRDMCARLHPMASRVGVSVSRLSPSARPRMR